MTSQPLRPYQAEAIEEARRAYREGARAILIVGPTAFGKTRVGVELAQSAIRKGGTVWWFAHREELLRQAHAALVRDGMPQEMIGIIAPWASFSRDAPVQIASIETMVAIRKRGGELTAPRIAIFDEAHHLAADTYRAIVIEILQRGTVSLGLTATPERGDGRPLGDVFDRLIHTASVKRLQALGVIAPIVTFRHDFRTKNLSEHPVLAYQRWARPGARGFCYCTNVDHAESVAQTFNESGIPAAVIHGKTPPMLRWALLEAFRTQSIAPLRANGSQIAPPLMLTNVYALREGVDVPEAEIAILACGFGHAGGLIQCAGRIGRAHPSKLRGVLVDLCGSTNELGLPEEDREYSLDGQAITRMSTGKGSTVTHCKACGCVFERWRMTTDGKRQCPECGELGHEMEPIRVEPRAMGIAGRAASLQDKKAAWARLVAKAAEGSPSHPNGYQIGWAKHKFKAMFLHWPTREIMASSEMNRR
jgi:superfamily II DNA or RNA helicase